MAHLDVFESECVCGWSVYNLLFMLSLDMHNT